MKTLQSDQIKNYTEDFHTRYADLSADRILEHDLRYRSFDQFTRLGFDTRGREDWKYGDISPMATGHFQPFNGGEDTSACFEDLIAPHSPIRMVFLNGCYRPALSNLNDLPSGARVIPLALAGERLALGDVSRESDAVFTALNGAFWSDGLVLELADEVVVEKPIELFFITDAAADAGLVAPRNLILANRGSRATVIEHYVGPGNVSTLSSLLNIPVTEVLCAEDSEIHHYKIMRENAKVLHTGTTYVRQSAGSRYVSREIVLGGGTTRRELHIDLSGPRAACDIRALYMGGGRQRLDMRTRIRHSAPGCETRELYKCILDGQAQAVFDGLIHVARDAQQTSAHQTNRNLLLSDAAIAYSIPRLEIYADDVKCSHGATTGQLDDAQLFYLRSRGFDTVEAREMLAGAFAREILADLEPETLRAELLAEVVGRLGNVEAPGGVA